MKTSTGTLLRLGVDVICGPVIDRHRDNFLLFNN
jgi:hypothetical protein